MMSDCIDIISCFIKFKKNCLRSPATASLFHKYDAIDQGDEENRTRQTLLFTISNSGPISFSKDSTFDGTPKMFLTTVLKSLGGGS